MKCPARTAVIIPFYNREAVLARAIESVLNGEDQDFHLYLVDDASTDQSTEVAKRFARDFSDKVSLIELPENQGVSAARNEVLKKVDSQYYALLDSDDEWLPGKLKSQFELLAETGDLICHTEEIWIRNGVRVNQMKKHQKFGGWIAEHCFEMCKMSPSSILIHKDVFAKVGFFKEDFPVCEDFDLWLRIVPYFRVSFVEQAQIKKYGGHDDQLSRKFFAMDYWRVLSLFDYLEKADSDEVLRSKAGKLLEKKLRILSKGYLRHENFTKLKEMEALTEKFLALKL